MATNKLRKRRKPMTKEQRAAAAERLAKARAAKGEPKNLSLHKNIRDLPDDHPISPAKVKKWLKSNKEALAVAKKDARWCLGHLCNQYGALSSDWCLVGYVLW